ncbi:MAG: adenosylcobinamide-phosphate synthase CbiB [Bacteroidales bacterium]|jgi:adenosylcobinamide-phosphate synthase|nr:adenosylcobinamide-phosphate synthase CbiB [Bacteroidales bacterium]
MVEAALIIILAIILDWTLGDPVWIPHPVILFGRGISYCEKRYNKGTHRVRKGALTSIALMMFTYVLSSVMMQVSYRIQYYFGVGIEIVFLFLGLAGTTLIKEGKAVFAALDRSLDEGRVQVGRIVGRDTSQLTAQQVKKATLETLAENLSDGVIAPLFWYAVAGIPGMLTYKMINTLDSMIGYKNERYMDYGRIAAKVDDVANWIPARLTAYLMCLVSKDKRSWDFVKRYGKAHSSPNAGYPEAALAGILNVRFGGPSNYFGAVVDKPYIGNNDREINNEDIKKTVKINRYSEVMMLVLVILIKYINLH